MGTQRSTKGCMTISKTLVVVCAWGFDTPLQGEVSWSLGVSVEGLVLDGSDIGLLENMSKVSGKS